MAAGAVGPLVELNAPTRKYSDGRGLRQGTSSEQCCHFPAPTLSSADLSRARRVVECL